MKREHREVYTIKRHNHEHVRICVYARTDTHIQCVRVEGGRGKRWERRVWGGGKMTRGKNGRKGKGKDEVEGRQRTREGGRIARREGGREGRVEVGKRGEEK